MSDKDLCEYIAHFTINIVTTEAKVTTMDDLVRPDLQNYSPASNLSLNEEIRKRLAAGETIYHFAFGQSPFPIIETAVEALKEYAGENAYLPVAGKHNTLLL